MRRTFLAACAALLLLPGIAHAGAAAFGDPGDATILEPAIHPKAFPTAQGFGKTARVRGGALPVVYVINSLADTTVFNDTAITFRECAEGKKINTPGHAVINTEGLPRYCIFRKGGQIKLTSPLVISNPKVWIAGETAVGDGIEITMDIVNWTGSWGSVLQIDTSDVIVTHLRVRGQPHGTLASVDRPSVAHSAILVNSKSDRVMIDHVSMGYTTDQVMTVYGGKNITVSNSIIGPMFCSDPGELTGHNEKFHCRPNLLSGASNVTFYNNFIAYGRMRWANGSGGARDPADSDIVVPGTWGQIDYINNVGYYFTHEAGLVGNGTGHTFANYIGNTVWQPRFSGVVQPSTYPIILWNQDGVTGVAGRDLTGFRVHHSNNRFWRSTYTSEYSGYTNPAPYCGVTNANPPVLDCAAARIDLVNYAVAPENVGLNGTGLSIAAADIQTPQLAEQVVLSTAGAFRCRSTAGGALTGTVCRNEIDTAIITDYQRCHDTTYTPKFSISPYWPTSRAQAFGDDVLANATLTKTDTDKDGMPDDWEINRGINQNTWNANNNDDGDDYYNIEEFINWYSGVSAYYNFQRVGPSPAVAVPADNCGNPINP